mgnify:CR=1 FL=1
MSSACNSAVHLRPSDSTPWCSTTELHTLYGEQGPIQIGISNGPCSPWSLCGLVVEHQSAESKGLRFNSSLGLMRWFLWWDKKKIFLYFSTDLKTYLILILLTKHHDIDTADPRSIQDACHIWTSEWALLTIDSLWLSGRASECGIQRSEVQFLIRTQNFFFVPHP